ncbi:MAG: hypothetical protein M1816_004654 [Peltula sp. TS41687]|nr:MAG: hypothetical protein M1816_004654 [Peltula sp. TS41687]
MAGWGLAALAAAFFGSRQLRKGHQERQWTQDSEVKPEAAEAKPKAVEAKPEAVEAKRLIENLQKQADRTVNSRSIEEVETLQKVIERANTEAAKEYPWTFIDEMYIQLYDQELWLVGPIQKYQFEWGLNHEYNAGVTLTGWKVMGQIPWDPLLVENLNALVDMCLPYAMQATAEIK